MVNIQVISFGTRQFKNTEWRILLHVVLIRFHNALTKEFVLFVLSSWRWRIFKLISRRFPWLFLILFGTKFCTFRLIYSTIRTCTSKKKLGIPDQNVRLSFLWIMTTVKLNAVFGRAAFCYHYSTYMQKK